MPDSAKFMSSPPAAEARAHVSKQPGHYLHPRFSPDGKSVVVERSTGGTMTSPTWSADPGIYRIAVDSGAAVRLTDEGRDPHFVGNDGRIYFTSDKAPKETEPAHELVSVDANGQDRRVHARSATWPTSRCRPRASGWRSSRTITSTSADAAGRTDRPVAADKGSPAAARDRHRRHVHQLDRRRHAVVDPRLRRSIARRRRSCSPAAALTPHTARSWRT